MKLVDRLILRELFGPLMNSIFMFLMLLFSSTYLFKFTDLLVQGVPFGEIAQLVLYSLPGLLTQTLPMGLLLGGLLAFGRLSGDSEHIALFSSGISFYRIVRPIIWVGLLLSLLNFFLDESVVPPATRELYRLETDLQSVRASTSPLHYDIKRPNSDHVDEIVNVDGGFDPKTKTLRDVTIFKMSEDPKYSGIPIMIVHADRAIARDTTGQNWTFYKGWIQPLSLDPHNTVYTVAPFDDITTAALPKNVHLEKDFTSIMQVGLTDNHTMTFRELRDKINMKREQGSRDTLGDEVDLWGKLSLPLACLIFGLVGAPLGVRPQRGNRTVGFGLAIAIIFLYWVVYNWMYQVGKGGSLPPLLASFMADIFGVIAATILVARTRQ